MPTCVGMTMQKRPLHHEEPSRIQPGHDIPLRVPDSWLVALSSKALTYRTDAAIPQPFDPNRRSPSSPKRHKSDHARILHGLSPELAGGAALLRVAAERGSAFIWPSRCHQETLSKILIGHTKGAHTPNTHVFEILRGWLAASCAQAKLVKAATPA
jgi:hypothetical protein